MVSRIMHPRLNELFAVRFGVPPLRSSELRAHGSDRKLHRLHGPGGLSAVGVEHSDADENRAFLSFSRHFRTLGLPVPEIYGEDLSVGVYLEEDLGDNTLFDLLQRERGEAAVLPGHIAALYEKSVRTLAIFQIRGLPGLDTRLCYPHAAFDRRSMTWDLNYFKYYFLKLARISFHEQRLENDFDALCDFLLRAPSDFLLYRDFQSRNIMIRDDRPWLIDYQGCRRGALHYDLASLLLDAKANLPFDFRDHLRQTYFEAVSGLVPFEASGFNDFFRGFSLIRTLQAMGAYGYRGFYERKTHFLQSVPYAIRNIEHLLEEGELPVALPELWEVLRRLVCSASLRSISNASLPLTVKVESFSYKNGYPGDNSGHGGGFVFDCRALPNPGRELRFSKITGLDDEVVSWLKSHDEVEAFLSQVRHLLLPTLDAYQKRGFTHLSVAFGCTGGRHRSVFCAEALAAWLRSRTGITVDLQHREAAAWGNVFPTTHT